MKKNEFLIISFDENYLRVLRVQKKGKEFLLKNPIYHPIEEGNFLETLSFVSHSYPLKGEEALLLWPRKKSYSTLLKLPPMGKKEARKVIENELKDMVPFSGEFVFEYLKVRGKEEDFYYIVASESSEIEKVLKNIEKLGLNIKGIIWKELSVQLVLGEIFKNLGIASFLHLHENSGSFYLFKDGVVLISRDFAISPGRESESIREEILRSIQYFKQFMREFVTEEIFILASPQYRNSYKDFLPSPMRITDVEDSGILERLPFLYSEEISEKLQEFHLIFLPLLGATLLQKFPSFPSLIPEDHIYSTKISSAIAYLSIEIILSIALLSAGIFLLSSYKARSEKMLKRIEAKYSQVEGKISKIESAKNKRLDFWKKYFDLYSNVERANIMGNIIKDFSENAPVSAVFDAVNFSFKGKVVRFKIAGGIIEEPGKGNQEFLYYFDKMKAFYPNIEFNSLKTVMEAEPSLAGNTPVTKVKFIISGEKEIKIGE